MSAAEQRKNTASDFEKKLVRYALMGGAVLGASTAAQASIVTYTYNENISDNGTPIQVSFDQTSTIDFTLSATSGEDGPFFYAGVYVNGPSTTLFAGAPESHNYNLPFALSGEVNLVGMNLVGSPAKLRNFVKFKTEISEYGGYWSNNTDAYLGVIFQRSGQNYEGWAEISVNVTDPSATATLIQTAYDTTPVTLVPEPSSLALFALGALGIAAVKKRRKTA